jgi:hypothetical protein
MTQNSNYTGGFVLNFTLFGSPAMRELVGRNGDK